MIKFSFLWTVLKLATFFYPIVFGDEFVQVALICSNNHGIRGWYNASYNLFSGYFHDLQSFNGYNTTSFGECYSLLPSTLKYQATGEEETSNYLTHLHNNFNSTVSIGDWNDVNDAINVIGISNFVNFVPCCSFCDCYFATRSGNVRIGNRNYFVSRFAANNIPGWYAVFQGPISDGSDAIVLGSFKNTLPILGKLTNIKIYINPDPEPTPIPTTKQGTDLLLNNSTG